MAENKQYIKQHSSLLDVDKDKEAKYKAELKITESGGSIEIDNIGPRDFIISQLYLLELKLKISKISLKEKNKRLAEIDRALEFIRNNIETIHYNKAGKDLKNIQYTFGLYPGVKEKNPRYNKELEDIFLTPGSPVRYIVSYSLFGENVIKKGAEVEKLHKQPRSLLKTVAQRISNTTETPTLFTLGGAIKELKEEISKNTGALAFYLIQKYQENNNKPLEITNLNAIAEVMNCNNHRLKLYLLYLGGYVYPITDRDEVTKEIVLTNEQLFHIQFRYNEERVRNRYTINEKGEIQGVERIGNSLLNFIKDEQFDRVIITPSPRFINALFGKGLGNILTVNDKFVGLILELTDIATKILSYSSSNKPSQKIAEDNLVKHLGLTKQIKKQGKPRVRATILKGLQELQDKGHIKSYSYEEATGMYSYTYSDKYVRYKEPKKDKKNPPEGVQ
jgi:hypothetical protein